MGSRTESEPRENRAVRQGDQSEEKSSKIRLEGELKSKLNELENLGSRFEKLKPQR